ncbi:MAG: N-acetyl sugar amidotransferase, partial [Rhodospirillaceae bacterium]|nr:N-acetyl sugar amidotransferase [Rhodospirillaceae bacterium]
RYLSIDPSHFPVASRRFEQPTMTRDSFMAMADGFRSPHLWNHTADSWQLRHRIWD